MNKKFTDTENKEFQKYLFYSQKARELEVLRKNVGLLCKYGNMNWIHIRKALRISSDRWGDYMLGEIMLPDFFNNRFENKFSVELEECRAKDRRAKLDWYFERPKSSADQKEVA